MKNKKYHSVETVQTPIRKSISHTYIHMTTHFPIFAQVLQYIKKNGLINRGLSESEKKLPVVFYTTP
jgi:hypothetical protein